VESSHLLEGNHVAALVSLRPEEVGIDVIAQNSLLFSRGAPLKFILETPASPEERSDTGSEDRENTKQAENSPDGKPSAAKSFLEAVTIEVVRSLHSYGGVEPQAPVTRLIVTGATGQESLVADVLRERLQLPCGIFDPAEELEIPEDARGEAGGALGAIGLGVGVNDAEGLPFDFLNPKRPAVQRNMSRIRMLSTIAAASAVVIALLGLRSHWIHQRLKIYQAVQGELASAQKKEPLYRRMQLQEAAVQTWTKEGRNWLEHYAYLSAVLPPSEEIYLTSLTISSQGNIHLAVQARSGETLASLEKQLRAAGYEVKPLAITPGSDKFGYNFRSTVELIVPAKLKIDLAKLQVPARPADDGSLDPKKRAGGKGGRS
jgi:hypothetical protein